LELESFLDVLPRLQKLFANFTFGPVDNTET
jgi:hypothetical protein